jgi:hypothetical protein
MLILSRAWVLAGDDVTLSGWIRECSGPGRCSGDVDTHSEIFRYDYFIYFLLSTMP